MLEEAVKKRYSDRLHDFSVTIPRCYKDVYVNSFFPRTARLWNSLPIECFPLTYDLSGFKSRINSMWKNNNNSRLIQVFIKFFFDDAFQACLCLLSSHV